MSPTSTQRQAVIQRAGGCCEYCRVGKTDETSPFHIDHIVPIKHHGTDTADNLCLACYRCNAFKGSNMAAADPLTSEATFLFDPRKQNWNDHFQINPNGVLTGLTAVGRVTVDVMRINDERRVQYRQLAMAIGEYPCEQSRTTESQRKR